MLLDPAAPIAAPLPLQRAQDALNATRGAVISFLEGLAAPFTALEGMPAPGGAAFEARVRDVREWLARPATGAALAEVMLPAAAAVKQSPGGAQAPGAGADSASDEVLEAQCATAFAAVHAFEQGMR